MLTFSFNESLNPLEKSKIVHVFTENYSLSRGNGRRQKL